MTRVRAPLHFAMRRSMLALAILTAACTTIPEIDPIAGSVEVSSFEAFPAPYSYGMQVVTLVGPPGATHCGLLRPHTFGAKWSGRVDADGAVSILLPPRGMNRQSPYITYQCRIVTPEAPRGVFVQRMVRDISLPINAGLRARFLEQFREAHRNGCPPEPLEHSSALPCGVARDGFGATFLFQPYIIHMGDGIDREAAHERWTDLHRSVQERCRVDPNTRCSYLDDATWSFIEAADINQTFDWAPARTSSRNRPSPRSA